MTVDSKTEKGLKCYAGYKSTLTCSHGSKGFYVLVFDPVRVRVLSRKGSEVISNHICVHHKTDIFGNLRHKMHQIGSILGPTCQN